MRLMRISMYLYWRDDQDIIALKASRGKDFLRVVRECLTAYLNGEPYSFPPIWAFAQSYSNETVTLSFSEERDAGIIEFLKLQPKGQQSNTVKYILRAYMDGFHDENYQAKSMEENFVRMKLSSGHDADLLCLYYYNEKIFPQWVMQAVRAYVRGEPYQFMVPEDWTPIQGKEIRSRTVMVPFSADDRDVVGYLDGIKDGLREGAMKNIFRSAFSRPLLCAGMELEFPPERKRRPSPKSVGDVQEGTGSGTGTGRRGAHGSVQGTFPAMPPGGQYGYPDAGAAPAMGKVFPAPAQGKSNLPYGSGHTGAGRQGFREDTRQAPVQEMHPQPSCQHRRAGEAHMGGSMTAGAAPWQAPAVQGAMQRVQAGRVHGSASMQEPETEDFDMDMFDGLGR